MTRIARVRGEQVDALAAEHNAYAELMISGLYPYQHLAIFEPREEPGRRVLRDYADEWHREANVPDDAILYDWSAAIERYVRR